MSDGKAKGKDAQEHRPEEITSDLKGKAAQEHRPEGPELILSKEEWLQDQKVNIYCKTNILKTLKQKMTPSQKRVLRKSVMSNFLELPTSNFPTQLLLQILRRRVANSNKRVLSFNIEGAEIEFTMADFALLTGLNCEEERYIGVEQLPPGAIERDFLHNYASPRLVNFLDRIKQYDFTDDELSVKVAKLAILESIVIARGPQNKMETLHLRLVDDNDMFESYPWGRIAYEHLVKSVENSVTSHRSTSMTVTGFVYAFIYWAYEIIPKLTVGDRYGKRIGSGIPRIKNWDVYHVSDSKKLQRDIFNDKMIVEPMHPTEDELNLEYLATLMASEDSMFDDEDSGGHVRQRRSEGGWGYMYGRHQGNEGGSTAEASARPTSFATLNEIQDIIMAGFATINEKLDSLHDRMDRYEIGVGGWRKDEEHANDPSPPHSTFVPMQTKNWPAWGTPEIPVNVEPKQTEKGGADVQVDADPKPVEDDHPLKEVALDETANDPQDGQDELYHGSGVPFVSHDETAPDDNTDKAQDPPAIKKDPRPSRPTKPSVYDQEPYTTDFGSSSANTKKTRVDTRASSNKRGRRGGGAKKGKRGAKTVAP